MVDLLVDEVCSPFCSLSLVKEGEMFKKIAVKKKKTRIKSSEQQKIKSPFW